MSMTAPMMTIGGIGRNGDPSGDRLTLAQHIPKNMGVICDSSSSLKDQETPFFINEQEFLSDHIRYLLFGTDTPFFSFVKLSSTHNSNGNEDFDYNIDIKINVSNLQPNQIGALNNFLELALILKKLSILTSSRENTLSASIVAFHMSIKQSIQNFQNLLDDLFNKSVFVSFISFQSKMQNSFSSFRHIYFLYLKSKSLTLTQYLSLLHDYTLFSDSLIQNISIPYFKQCTTPYFDILSNWVLLGELSEKDFTIEKFFVSLSSVPREDFNFDKNNVPSFIDGSIANKIYQTGKTVFYLKNIIGDISWCNEFQSSNSNIIKFDNLDTVVPKLYELVIKRLDELLLEEFKIQISYLNKFLLMNQSDLVNVIIIEGSQILENRSNHLSSRQLIHLLQDSIESSSIIHNFPSVIYNNLDARLLNLNTTESNGWDLFTLDFKVPNKINYLIHDSYKEYLRVFNFLFKINKIKFKLSESWKNSNNLGRSTKLPLAKYNPFQKRFYLIRHQFISFIDSIYTFINNEIISLSYKHFMDRLNGSDSNVSTGKLLPFHHFEEKKFNLEDLTSLHRKYIMSISRSELFYNINNSSVPINQILFKLLSTVESFLSLSNEFQTLINDLLTLENSKMAVPKFDEYVDVLDQRINQIMYNLHKSIIDPFENDLILLVRSLNSSKNESLKCLGLILEN